MEYAECQGQPVQSSEIWMLELPPSQILILLAIHDHIEKSGEDKPWTIDEIARKTNYEERQVRRIIRQLQDIGALILVRIGRGPKNPNRYSLSLQGIPRKPTFKDYRLAQVKRKPVTLDIFTAVWGKSDGLCWYCGELTDSITNFCVDHFIPLSKGGEDILSNMVPCCRTCNIRKGNKFIHQFREFVINRIHDVINKNASIHDDLDKNTNSLLLFIEPKYNDRKILSKRIDPNIPLDDIVQFHFERHNLTR